jgi:hypothetical protein
MTTTAPSLSAAPPAPVPSRRRGWAVAGAVAGLAGVVGIQVSAAIDAVYDDKYLGDAAKITERLGDLVPQLLVLHGTMMAASLLLLVFAAGLRHRLQGQAPAASLLPDIAAGGLMLTSVATLLGVAFTTEIVFGVTADDLEIDPEFGAMVGHWVGTVPWLWVGAGVTGLAVAVAALRHAAAPRWIGWVAAVLGALTTIAGVSPLQYMAGFTGPLLILLLGLGFAFGDRSAGTPTRP